MLTLLGSPRRCCDGITRRETLKAGALTALGGFGLPQLAAAEEAGAKIPGKAKNVILLYLLGGAATQDMWDMKPTGPAETRGEFKPVATNVPGIDICEHMPQMTQWMHRTAIVRSVNHKAGCHNCLPSYSGWELPPPNQHPTDNDPPSMGSVCEYLRTLPTSRALGQAIADRSGRTLAEAAAGREADIPAYAYLPNWLGWGQAFRRAGPYAGFLGKRFDPLTTECEPFWDKQGHNPLPGRPQIVRGVPVLAGSTLQDGITLDRLNLRRSLLEQFEDRQRQAEAAPAPSGYTRAQEQAFGLLTSSKLRSCFDLSAEEPKMVDRYGRTLFGQSTLIARRLIETGVKFVNVTWDLYWDRVQVDYDAWDTHQQNFWVLKHNKLPNFDLTFSALLEDLETRGLLDETLVVVMSEMGRTPRINGNGGRDHWTFCYSVAFAGAGIRGGTLYGESDAQAAYVKSNPVSTADICATIYSLLGINPEFRVPDRTNRPMEIAHGGRAISEIMA
jgi:hypothetical protein